MPTSVFELFKIGIGPSSSHTVGPMLAAKQFLLNLKARGLLDTAFSLECQLYGSLALTGKGHGTDTALILGLMGEDPKTVDTDSIPIWIADCEAKKTLNLLGEKEISFDPKKAIQFFKRYQKPHHANAVTFIAKDEKEAVIEELTVYSVGGGNIQTEAEIQSPTQKSTQKLAYPFSTADELLQLSQEKQLSIAEMIWENEKISRDEDEIIAYLRLVWKTMQGTVDKGFRTRGILPGGLSVKRRAPDLYEELSERDLSDPSEVFDWLSVFALATNEENAAGGRVVTAPTNGAAGIIPAVLHYCDKFVKPVDDEVLKTFFLTATAVGSLYQKNASISGAEMGCQGEVGVASSMAAAGLCAVRGGDVIQVENAAEIAMEHHLGLTCDPIKGLVQIPCIERNTMGAIKAVNAARLAYAQKDNSHIVSLDKVIRTMKKTGEDMRKKYKETALGGLAVHVPEC